MSSYKIQLGTLGKKACGYFDDKREARLLRFGYDQYASEENPLHISDPSLPTSFRCAAKGISQQPNYNYITDCPTCNACVPLRVNTDKFTLSKSQKKLIAKTDASFKIENNHNLNRDELYLLYSKYMQARHSEDYSGMQHWDKKTFNDWLDSSFLKLLMIKDDKIIGCSLLDMNGDNTVLYYSFFDPDYSKDSPGKQLWLTAITTAIQNDLKHVYVGTWAKDSPKLDYKKDHSGLETYDVGTGKWVDFDPEIHTSFPKYKDLINADALRI